MLPIYPWNINQQAILFLCDWTPGLWPLDGWKLDLQVNVLFWLRWWTQICCRMPNISNSHAVLGPKFIRSKISAALSDWSLALIPIALCGGLSSLTWYSLIPPKLRPSDTPLVSEIKRGLTSLHYNAFDVKMRPILNYTFPWLLVNISGNAEARPMYF